MFRISLFFLLLSGSVLHAQSADSLFVSLRSDGWAIQHQVRAGETIFSVSRRFHVPPAVLAHENGMTYDDGLRTETTVAVPLGAYNFLDSQPRNTSESRPLYYRVRPGDDLYRISRSADVSRRSLQAWNNLPDDQIGAGQVLQVGWVLFDATQIGGTTVPVVPKPAPAPVAVDTPSRAAVPEQAEPVEEPASVPARPLATEEAAFQELAAAGVNFTVETGPAAFFPSSSKTTIYAFHNIAPRGSVVRVRNPVNGRTVYAKVLGPLPGTRLYAKALIGLSAGARRQLGATGDARLWCEVAYAGY